MSVYREYHEAFLTIKKAQASLAKATCHGRDFQHDRSEYFSARDERDKMFSHLAEVANYCEQWCEHAVYHIEWSEVA